MTSSMPGGARSISSRKAAWSPPADRAILAKASSTAATYLSRNRAISAAASISRTCRLRGPPGTARARSPSGAPKTSPSECAGSIESSSTRRAPSRAARSSAVAAAQVDLPTPPLPPKRSQRTPPSRRSAGRVSFRLKADTTGSESIPVASAFRRNTQSADAMIERPRHHRWLPRLQLGACLTQRGDAARFLRQVREREQLEIAETPGDRSQRASLEAMARGAPLASSASVASRLRRDTRFRRPQEEA